MRPILLFLLLIFANNIVAQTPQLVVPVGHNGGVFGAVFSHNNKLVATTGTDNTVKIWDIAEARLLITLYGHRNYVSGIEFSSNDHYLVTTSFTDSTTFIWDLDKAAIQLTIDAGNAADCHPLLSNDSKYAVVQTRESIDLYDLAAARKIRSFGKPGNFLTAAFTTNNDILATAVYNGKLVSLWNIASGKLIKQFATNVAVHQLQFLPGNNKIAINAAKGITVYDITTGKKLHEINTDTLSGISTRYSKDGRYYIAPVSYTPYEIKGLDTFNVNRYLLEPVMIDLLTNKTQKISAGNFKGNVEAVASDDKLDHLAVLCDSVIALFERTGQQYRLVASMEIRYSLDDWINISHDGKYVILPTGHSQAAVYSFDGKPVAMLRGAVAFDSIPYFSDNGKYIHTAGANRLQQCWNVVAGKFEYGCIIEDDYYTGKKEAEPQLLKDEQTKQWRVIVKNDTVVLKDEHSERLSASFVPGGQYLVTYFSDADSVIGIWDLRTGTRLQQFEYPLSQKPEFNNAGTMMALVKTYQSETLDRMWKKLEWEEVMDTVIQNGDTILTPSYREKVVAPADTVPFPAYTLNIINLPSGELQYHSVDSASELNGTRIYPGFTDNGKYFMLITDRVLILNTGTWQPALSIDHVCGGWSPNISFNSRGNRVLISCTNATTLYEAGTNKVLFTLPGSLSYSNFSEDEKYILTGSDDKRLKIWDATNGKLLYTWFGFENNNYLVTDEYGHFDGTEEARKALYFNCGNETVELAQVKDQLWVPGLAERIMRKDPINAAKLSELNICGLTPVIKNLYDHKTYHYNIIPRKGKLGETVVYVNDIEVKRYQPAGLIKNKDGSYSLSIPVDSLQAYFVAGAENKITVKAFTEKNEIASRGLTIKQTAEKKISATPNLYAVMVGVSDYKGTALDLQYAAKDAADISKLIQASAAKLLNTDGKNHVFMYDLNTSANHYMLPEKKSIALVLKEIGARAAANDILLIFFAGHGVTAGDKKQFYFLTADASKDADVTATGISTTELSEWIKPSAVKAQKRILIFDACNSGQAINDIVNIGKGDGYIAARNDDNTLQLKAIDKLNERSGLFILSAAASNQSAYEMGRLSQGLLTYALLRSVKEQSDILDQDKLLNVSRWFTAAEKIVEDMVRETGNRQEPQLVSTSTFNIGIVDKDIIASINLPREKPLFSASNFQNSNDAVADDDIELSKYVNQSLFEIASRESESRISYVTVTQSPDAYTLTGRYDIVNNSIKVRVNIRQNRQVKYHFDLEASAGAIQQLAKDIVQKASDWLAQPGH